MGQCQEYESLPGCLCLAETTAIHNTTFTGSQTPTMSHGKQFTLYTHVRGPSNGWCVPRFSIGLLAPCALTVARIVARTHRQVAFVLEDEALRLSYELVTYLGRAQGARVHQVVST